MVIILVFTTTGIAFFNLIEHNSKQILPLKFRRGSLRNLRVCGARSDYDQDSIRQIGKNPCILYA